MEERVDHSEICTFPCSTFMEEEFQHENKVKKKDGKNSFNSKSWTFHQVRVWALKEMSHDSESLDWLVGKHRLQSIRAANQRILSQSSAAHHTHTQTHTQHLCRCSDKGGAGMNNGGPSSAELLSINMQPGAGVSPRELPGSEGSAGPPSLIPIKSCDFAEERRSDSCCD